MRTFTHKAPAVLTQKNLGFFKRTALACPVPRQCFTTEVPLKSEYSNQSPFRKKLGLMPVVILTGIITALATDYLTTQTRYRLDITLDYLRKTKKLIKKYLEVQVKFDQEDLIYEEEEEEEQNHASYRSKHISQLKIDLSVISLLLFQVDTNIQEIEDITRRIFRMYPSEKRYLEKRKNELEEVKEKLNFVKLMKEARLFQLRGRPSDGREILHRARQAYKNILNEYMAKQKIDEDGAKLQQKKEEKLLAYVRLLNLYACMCQEMAKKDREIFEEQNKEATHCYQEVIDRIRHFSADSQHCEKNIKEQELYAHNGLGELAYLNGDYNNAISHYKNALQIELTDPLHAQFAFTHCQMGFCYHQLGDDSSAKINFKRALRAKPDYKKASRALKEIGADDGHEEGNGHRPASPRP